MKTRCPTALVTGATGGIGSHIAARLVENGYNVMACGRDTNKRIALTERMAFASSGHAAFGIDVPDYDTMFVDFNESLAINDLEIAVENCENKWEKLDLVVCAHGSPPHIRPTEGTDIAIFKDVFEVDVLGAVLTCQIAYEALKRAKGSIALISSFHALGTYPERTPYAMAKAAVCSLARSLCCEWAKDGIRVNAIAPGQVEGERTDLICKEVEEQTSINIKDLMKARSPAYKLVTLDDIFNTVFWLAKSPSVNGQTIVVDHGVMANLWYMKYEEQHVSTT